MQHVLRARDRAALVEAYGHLSDKPWVSACTIDVPALELQLHLTTTHAHRSALRWFERYGPAFERPRSR